MDRRSFLKTGLGAAAMGMTMGTLNHLASAAEKKRIPIALELYSLREVAPKDVPGTLKKVAEMGYEGVEFAGYYGLEAKELKKMIDDVGLVATSTHIGLGALLGDEFYKNADFCKELGMNIMIVPGGLEQAIRHEAGNQMTAHLFNELAIKAGAYDMRIGFHGHTGDYLPIEGTDQSAWEVFFNRCRPEVIAQIDIGWCNNAGYSPAEMIKKLPGRAAVVHVKSNNNDVKGCVAADSDDKVDWKPVFEACETVGGTEWYIVEQEQYKVSELDSARECLENLKKLGL